MTPSEITQILALYALALTWVIWQVAQNARRIRSAEIIAQERITRPALDAWGAGLMIKLDARFDAMEAAQARREEDRMAYLLKNAEELGGVRSTNQLLTGQLATLAAKLDRQIEFSRLASAPSFPAAPDAPTRA